MVTLFTLDESSNVTASPRLKLVWAPPGEVTQFLSVVFQILLTLPRHTRLLGGLTVTNSVITLFSGSLRTKPFRFVLRLATGDISATKKGVEPLSEYVMSGILVG